MAGLALVAEDAHASEASLRDALVAALEENRGLRQVAAELCEDNTRLRELAEGQAQELERVRADLTVLQRMLFGRSSERSRPEPSAAAGEGDRDGRAAGSAGEQDGDGEGRQKPKRGPGARAGRRDYSDLPRFEVFWDFPGGGYCCPQCGEPFTVLGDHVSGEQLDWQVIVRVVVHCRRRYKRRCDCRVPGTVMAPGPAKAIGKGLFSIL